MVARVRKGITDFTGSTLDLTISPVTPANSWVRLKPRIAGAAPTYNVTGELINGTTLRLQRATASGTNNVVWYVIEDSEATVQRGVHTMTANDETITVTGVDLTKSFISITTRTAVNTLSGGLVTAEFQNSTTVRFRKLQSGTVIVSWEVITISDAVVQSGVSDLPLGTTTVNAAISAVDPAHTFLLESQSASVDNLDKANTRVWMSSTTEVRSYRTSASAGDTRTSWFVVECPRYNVQFVESGYVSTQIVSITVTEVSQENTWLTSSARNSGSGTSNANARYNVYFPAALGGYDGSSDPEDGLTPTISYANLDPIVSTQYNSANPVLWSIDCTFDATTPSGTLIEGGGSGTGFWVGITSNMLVARWGSGAAGYPNDTARIAIPTTDYDFRGFSGTVHVEFNIILKSVAIAFDEGSTNVVNYFDTNAAVTSPANWSGGDDGAVGMTAGSEAGITDEGYGVWNGTISQVRMYNTNYVAILNDPDADSIIRRHKASTSQSTDAAIYVVEMISAVGGETFQDSISLISANIINGNKQLEAASSLNISSSFIVDIISEILSDLSGVFLNTSQSLTGAVEQSIETWTDTEITFTSVQGALPDNTSLELAVRLPAGDITWSPVSVIFATSETIQAAFILNKNTQTIVAKYLNTTSNTLLEKTYNFEESYSLIYDVITTLNQEFTVEQLSNLITTLFISLEKDVVVSILSTVFSTIIGDLVLSSEISIESASELISQVILSLIQANSIDIASTFITDVATLFTQNFDLSNAAYLISDVLITLLNSTTIETSSSFAVIAILQLLKNFELSVTSEALQLALLSIISTFNTEISTQIITTILLELQSSMEVEEYKYLITDCILPLVQDINKNISKNIEVNKNIDISQNIDLAIISEAFSTILGSLILNQVFSITEVINILRTVQVQLTQSFNDVYAKQFVASVVLSIINNVDIDLTDETILLIRGVFLAEAQSLDNAVKQSIETWTDNEIVFTNIRGGLPLDTALYLAVRTDAGDIAWAPITVIITEDEVSFATLTINHSNNVVVVKQLDALTNVSIVNSYTITSVAEAVYFVVTSMSQQFSDTQLARLIGSVSLAISKNLDKSSSKVVITDKNIELSPNNWVAAYSTTFLSILAYLSLNNAISVETVTSVGLLSLLNIEADINYENTSTFITQSIINLSNYLSIQESRSFITNVAAAVLSTIGAEATTQLTLLAAFDLQKYYTFGTISQIFGTIVGQLLVSSNHSIETTNSLIAVALTIIESNIDVENLITAVINAVLETTSSYTLIEQATLSILRGILFTQTTSIDLIHSLIGTVYTALTNNYSIELSNTIITNCILDIEQELNIVSSKSYVTYSNAFFEIDKEISIDRVALIVSNILINKAFTADTSKIATLTESISVNSLSILRALFLLEDTGYIFLNQTYLTNILKSGELFAAINAIFSTSTQTERYRRVFGSLSLNKDTEILDSTQANILASLNLDITTEDAQRAFGNVFSSIELQTESDFVSLNRLTATGTIYLTKDIEQALNNAGILSASISLENVLILNALKSLLTTLNISLDNLVIVETGIGIDIFAEAPGHRIFFVKIDTREFKVVFEDRDAIQNSESRNLKVTFENRTSDETLEDREKKIPGKSSQFNVK